MTDSYSKSPIQLEPFAVPSGRRTRGRLRVPSSKSLTHRYLNLALLSGAPVVIERPLYAEAYIWSLSSRLHYRLLRFGAINIAKRMRKA